MNIWRLNDGKKISYPLADITDTKEFLVKGQYENHPFLRDGKQQLDVVSGITLLLDDKDGKNIAGSGEGGGSYNIRYSI